MSNAVVEFILIFYSHLSGVYLYVCSCELFPISSSKDQVVLYQILGLLQWAER